MTAIELFAFIFVVLGAILEGIYGSRFGPGGQVAGIILGSILGFLCNGVLWLTLFWIGSVLEWWRPEPAELQEGEVLRRPLRLSFFSAP